MRTRNPSTTCLVSLVLVSMVSLAACEAKKASPDPSAAASASASGSPAAMAIPSGASNAAPPAEQPPAPPPIPAPSDVAAAPADAQKTASGLASKLLTKGTGKVHPSESDKVKVNYTGWTSNGEMFDSSITRGKPIEFPLNTVIDGWAEGLKLMVVGEKRRLWIPAKLAYGERPAQPGAPAGNLTFDVELLDVTVAPKPPPVPADVKAVPASAKKTASGLAYRLLSPGTGTEHPKETDNVRVNYTGWTTDGKMFDSSIPRGEPSSFRLDHVIKGWTEGVQLMKVGDKMRFWIPGDLAYGDKPTRPGAPSGTLVFDVELVDIRK